MTAAAFPGWLVGGWLWLTAGLLVAAAIVEDRRGR